MNATVSIDQGHDLELSSRQRNRIAIAFATAATLVLGLGVLGLATGRPISIPLGLGRVAHLLAGAGFGTVGACIAAAEYTASGVFLGLIAGLLARGETPVPVPYRGHQIVRTLLQRRRAWLIPTLKAAGLLIGGLLISATGHAAGLALPAQLIAAVLESYALVHIGAVMWRVIVPENRVRVTVIRDPVNRGFNNRVEVAGGRFNRLGRVIIRQDQLLDATVVDRSISRLLGVRDLYLAYEDAAKKERLILVQSAGDERMVAGLVHYLRAEFITADKIDVWRYPMRFRNHVEPHF